jgi:hypothetical protein
VWRLLPIIMPIVVGMTVIAAPMTLHVCPSLSGTGRKPGTHLLKGAFALDVFGP